MGRFKIVKTDLLYNVKYAKLNCPRKFLHSARMVGWMVVDGGGGGGGGDGGVGVSI